MCLFNLIYTSTIDFDHVKWKCVRDSMVKSIELRCPTAETFAH